MTPRAFAAVLVLALAGCSGGGGGSSSATTTPPPTTTGFTDPTVYSSAATASLATPNEITTVTHRTITLDGVTRAYTVKAGHLTALAPGSNQPEASFFHVAYTLDGVDAATRPVTFFYNGGPGSATVWLHLGSYGPRRIATDTPGAAGPVPYPLVDNVETLLDTTDLVFVDMVGSGYSQAIAPFTNKSFWGVDADAAVFRDFVTRWLAVNARQASPKFLFGESYGTTRSAVLARLLESGGVALRGVVLLSSALNYNSNCGLTETTSCSGLLPTYNAAASWHGLAAQDLAQARRVADEEWEPAIQATHGTVPATPDPALVARLASMTGLTTMQWSQHFNMDIGFFGTNLRPGRVVGLYDARVSAPVGTPLAQGDPSSNYVGNSFATRIVQYLRDELGYSTPSTYTMLSGAHLEWNYGHDGRPLPDTVPDLAAALALNPQLRVYSIGGQHDLVTPFHTTERDTARLGSGVPLTHAYLPGGHMTYLDDASRRQQKLDVANFIRGTP